MNPTPSINRLHTKPIIIILFTTLKLAAAISFMFLWGNTAAHAQAAPVGKSKNLEDTDSKLPQLNRAQRIQKLKQHFKKGFSCQNELDWACTETELSYALVYLEKSDANYNQNLVSINATLAYSFLGQDRTNDAIIAFQSILRELPNWKPRTDKGPKVGVAFQQARLNAEQVRKTEMQLKRELQFKQLIEETYRLGYQVDQREIIFLRGLRGFNEKYSEWQRNNLKGIASLAKSWIRTEGSLTQLTGSDSDTFLTGLGFGISLGHQLYNPWGIELSGGVTQYNLIQDNLDTNVISPKASMIQYQGLLGLNFRRLWKHFLWHGRLQSGATHYSIPLRPGNALGADENAKWAFISRATGTVAYCITRLTAIGIGAESFVIHAGPNETSIQFSAIAFFEIGLAN